MCALVPSQIVVEYLSIVALALDEHKGTKAPQWGTSARTADLPMERPISPQVSIEYYLAGPHLGRAPRHASGALLHAQRSVSTERTLASWNERTLRMK